MRNGLPWLAALGLMMSCSPGCEPEIPAPEPSGQTARVPVPSSCGLSAVACYDGFARQPANLVCFRPSSRWSHTTLTWNIANPIPSIDAQVQELLAAAAFNLWDDASALSFVEVPTTETAEICIHFDSGSDNGAFPFDGPGGHLALAYFPGSARPGAIYLSDVETWTVPPSEAEYLLYVVLVHEIGHALGLEHSLTPGTIMYPNYQGPIAGLSSEDVRAIQRLYGSSDGTVAPLEVLPPSACGPPANLTALGDPDTDGDGIPDSIELLVLGGDPLEGDTDGDGVNDFHEVFSVVFEDDFESYSLGAFPAAGGWSLLYSGAGSSSQYVDDTNAVSGAQALHLAGGSSCWSATVVHDVVFPQKFSYEASVYVDQIVGCGCSSYLVELGTSAGYHLGFFCDGQIYAVLRYDPQVAQALMPYQARTWYHLRVDVDRSTGLFDVYVNGALLGARLQSLDTGVPTLFFLAAEHGASPVAWFDDVKITQ